MRGVACQPKGSFCCVGGGLLGGRPARREACSVGRCARSGGVLGRDLVEEGVCFRLCASDSYMYARLREEMEGGGQDGNLLARRHSMIPPPPGIKSVAAEAVNLSPPQPRHIRTHTSLTLSNSPQTSCTHNLSCLLSRERRGRVVESHSTCIRALLSSPVPSSAVMPHT